MKTFNIIFILFFAIIMSSCVTSRGQEVIVIKSHPYRYYSYGNGFYEVPCQTSRYTCTTKTYEIRNSCNTNQPTQVTNVYVDGKLKESQPIRETKAVDNEMKNRMNYQVKTAEYNSYSDFQDECNRREQNNSLVNISDWKVTIHFYRNSANFEKETANDINIENVRDFLEKNPKASIIMDGYADIKTGNPDHNFKLASRRIKAVASKLLESPYIDSKQIKVNIIGDRKQIYVENKWNRCVVIYPQLNNY